MRQLSSRINSFRNFVYPLVDRRPEVEQESTALDERASVAIPLNAAFWHGQIVALQPMRSRSATLASLELLPSLLARADEVIE